MKSILGLSAAVHVLVYFECLYQHSTFISVRISRHKNRRTVSTRVSVFIRTLSTTAAHL